MPGVEALLDTKHGQIMAETGPATAGALLDIQRTSAAQHAVGSVGRDRGAGLGLRMGNIDGAGRPGQHVSRGGRRRGAYGHGNRSEDRSCD